MFNRSSRASSSATLALLILAAASLPACSPRSTRLGAISTNASPVATTTLDPQVRAPCLAPAKVTDGSPVGIASADADLALDYRKCAARHAAAVSSFDVLAEAYDKLRSAVLAGVKGGKHGK